MSKLRFLSTLLIFFAACTLFAAKPAKYVFLMIGDGMGENTVRLYTKLFPNSNFANFRKIVHTGTNNVHGSTTDSAASGTALACGIKTYNKAIGVDSKGTPRTSLARVLQKRNWKIGIISSVGINDATPGTHYANRATRGERAGILADMYASYFDFFGISMVLMPPDYEAGVMRTQLRRNGYTVVNGSQINTLKPGDRNVVISGTRYEDLKSGSPRLADVTAKAAELLSANGSNFFIMVEGGAVDHCNHRNDAVYSMREMIEFDAAIGAALKFAAKHPEETLIIVTADHETGGLMIKDLDKLSSGILSTQSVSSIAISSMLKKMKKAKTAPEALISAVCKALSLSNLSADEKSRLEKACKLFISGKKTKGDKLAASMGYGRYNPLVIEALRIRDQRNGFIYTSFSHTPVKVLTFVSGAGAEHFTAPMENSDIPHRIAAAAGLPGVLAKESTIPPFPVRRKITDNFDLYRVTTTSATMRYGFNVAKPRTFVLSTGKKVVVKDYFGKITFDGLTPDTDYSVSCGKYTIKFRTQKVITDKLLFKVGVISDAHITTIPDNLARMHSRSEYLVKEMLGRFAKQQMSFVFFPGDLTDKGLPGELEIAGKLLKSAKMKVLFTHGNHDIVNEKNQETWKKNFPVPAGIIVQDGVQIAWLNTGRGIINTPENVAVINKIDEKMPLLLFAHHQLIPDKYVAAKDKKSSVAEMRGKTLRTAPAAVKPLIEKLSRCRAIILVGHKNVASSIRFGKAIQVNMPQMTEYPAGALAVEVYASGVRFTFEPISDNFAEEQTRRRVAENPAIFSFRTRNTRRVWNQFIAW